MQWWLYWWRQVILSENDGFVDAGSVLLFSGIFGQVLCLLTIYHFWAQFFSSETEKTRQNTIWENAMMTLLMKTSDFKWERRLCGRRVPFCHLPSVLATNRFEWFSHLDPPNGTEHVNLGQISSFRTQWRNGESTNNLRNIMPKHTY
jgi:hypothetical protein